MVWMRSEGTDKDGRIVVERLVQIGRAVGLQ